jgi:hypothetical protein
MLDLIGSPLVGEAVGQPRQSLDFAIRLAQQQRTAVIRRLAAGKASFNMTRKISRK